jgi:hypothetical protein
MSLFSGFCDHLIRSPFCSKALTVLSLFFPNALGGEINQTEFLTHISFLSSTFCVSYLFFFFTLEAILLLVSVAMLSVLVCLLLVPSFPS